MTKLKINSAIPDDAQNLQEPLPDTAGMVSTENALDVAKLLNNTYSSVQELGPAFIVATEGDPVLVYRNASKNQWDVVPFRITGKQGILNENGTF